MRNAFEVVASLVLGLVVVVNSLNVAIKLTTTLLSTINMLDERLLRSNMRLCLQ